MEDMRHTGGDKKIAGDAVLLKGELQKFRRQILGKIEIDLFTSSNQQAGVAKAIRTAEKRVRRIVSTTKATLTRATRVWKITRRHAKKAIDIAARARGLAHSRKSQYNSAVRRMMKRKRALSKEIALVGLLIKRITQLGNGAKFLETTIEEVQQLSDERTKA